VISDLRELYQEVIVDHSKRPRNFRLLPHATNHAEGFNPLCGDRIALQIAVNDGVIKDAAFQGSGCAISTASASLMTETLKGKSLAEAEQLFGQFHQAITGETGVPRDLGKLAALAGVRDFPARVKCATLAWHTLLAALRASGERVSTE
jgi:nitrogen fixation NifU-like protein